VLHFASTIFLSAFLLFLVQPLLGRVVLPDFGGTPAVWTTCMLFFQLLLLGGYAYAHFVIEKLPARRQGLVHAGLLAVAVAITAPTILPGAQWRPTADGAPLVQILLLLGASVGAPYFTLSATGSLLQAWFARIHPHRSPYPLYALSNAGSLLGLLGFPFLVEPNLGTTDQASMWFWGYAVFALVCSALAIRVARSRGEGRTTGDHEAVEVPAPSSGLRMRWVGFAACGSALLLAITNRMSLDVASVPFLWVVPLALYLLSFIVCFGGERRYVRVLFYPALIAAEIGACGLMLAGPSADFEVQVLGWSAILFVLVMVCHGELYRLRPHPRHLTSFYLALSLGGALGGVFVGVLAPLLFTQYFELHIGLCATAVLTLDAFRRDPKLELGGTLLRAMLALLALAATACGVWAALVDPYSLKATAPLSVATALLLAFGWRFAVRTPKRFVLPWLAVLLLVGNLAWEAADRAKHALEISRSFFGVLRVTDTGDTPEHAMRKLYHGAILHGSQFTAPERQMWHNAYFAAESGVGLAIRRHPKYRERQPMRIGILGLGAGTLLTYGRAGDRLTVYEIDPDVERMSRTYFTYFANTPAEVDVVIGDGRLSLERQQAQGFDVLVLDAFSSDAIPLHLLTREAFDIYVRHLAPGGIIASNTTNRHVDIKPVLKLVAQERGMQFVWISTWPNDERAVYGADWVLLTNDETFAQDEEVRREAANADEVDTTGLSVWTDDHTNLIAALKWLRDPE
jgi:hypothetical protein